MSEKNDDKITLPKWSKGIDTKSVKKSIDAGVIFPQLKPQRNRVYKVECLVSEPKEITTELGKAQALDIAYEGMKYSLITPKSFIYQLTVEVIRKGVNDLTGHTLTFQKTQQKHETFGLVDMYSVQLD